MSAANCFVHGRPHIVLGHSSRTHRRGTPLAAFTKGVAANARMRVSATDGSQGPTTHLDHPDLQQQQPTNGLQRVNHSQQPMEQQQPTNGVQQMGEPMQPELPQLPLSKEARLEAAVLYGANQFLTHLRRLRWNALRPQELATNMLFVLGVILVNWGVESFLNYWLGDSPVGSIGCILMGAAVLTWLKVRRVPVSKALFSAFWN